MKNEILVIKCAITKKCHFNSYLCNKLGKVIFFRTRCGIFNRDEVEIKNASSTEKTLFLRIAHMIFSTGVWKIHKIWIFLIYY
jgi:hypothetical protein